MSMAIDNLAPSLESCLKRCKQSGRILASFIDPTEAFGMDKVISPSVLTNAKGLALITVVRAGFLGSARFGNGMIVARLADGTWSAPSAIAVAGARFGSQIGFDLTDFVLILNDVGDVEDFSQRGSLILGRNTSLAAGHFGEDAEAAGGSSFSSAAVLSYSKTKGLFAGVSLPGSSIVERRDINEKLYDQRYTARQLMGGSVRPPPAASSLMNVLKNYTYTCDSTILSEMATSGQRVAPNLQVLPSKAVSLEEDQTVALSAFDASEPGHLEFKKGEIITVMKMDDIREGWLAGMIDWRIGIFPSKYVEMSPLWPLGHVAS